MSPHSKSKSLSLNKQNQNTKYKYKNALPPLNNSYKPITGDRPPPLIKKKIKK
jgi:hypothetical protein